MSKFHERYARRALERLRKQEPVNSRGFWHDTTAKTLAGWLQDGNLTLEDIGSSEAELAKLRQEFYLDEARAGLEKFRSLRACNRDVLYIPLREAGKTLADIGTSEDELDELYVEYCKQKAFDLLMRARSSDVSHSHLHLEAIRGFMQRGELTAPDINSSEEELKRLAA